MKQKIPFFSIVTAVAASLMVWKITAVSVNSPVLPAPELVFRAFVGDVQTMYFWENFFVSARRVTLSMAAAWLLAFPAGIIMGYSRGIDRALAPVVFMTYPVPKMVLLPVVVLLFGLGDLSKIILITLILFFQILVSTRDGVKSIDRKYIDSVESMGGGKSHIIRHVLFPAALPHSFTALRISTGTAISVLFFAESFATTSGLGYMIMDAWGRAAYVSIFVGITGMSIMGLILYQIFTFLEKRLCAWNFPQKKSAGGGLIQKSLVYSRMIIFSHTLFVLPFILSGLVLALAVKSVTTGVLLWIAAAFIGGISAAIAFNRLADAGIDKENPRTSMRGIPAGTVSVREAVVFVVFSSLMLIFASAMISRLCFLLSFPLLAVLFFHSYTKRFTWFAHIYLGFAIGLAPAAVWIAVVGVPDISVILLCLALMTHVAGFDILYSCRDIDFDREKNLFSIPVRFGMERAFMLSSAMHAFSLFFIAAVYFTTGFGGAYLIFVILIALLFIIEHRRLNPEYISSNSSFYINGIISILVFAAVLTGSITGSLLSVFP